jgi:hypothetical protein
MGNYQGGRGIGQSGRRKNMGIGTISSNPHVLEKNDPYFFFFLAAFFFATGASPPS